MRVRVMLVSLGLIVGSAAIWSAEPSAAGPKPVRSGTIVGGTGLELAGGQPWENPALERSGCEYALDCLEWLHSGCNPALAGHDPVLTASIVDVGDLADGRTRRSLHTAAPKIPPWGLWPGAVVQLWRHNCTEIQSAKRHTIGSDSSCEWDPYPSVRCRAFRIPTDAKWMTLSGYGTTVQLTWTLA
jgi:hypothetical protein